MGATMKDRFTTAGLADAYSVLEKNGIDSLEILEDFIHKKAEKFGEWFPVLGTQLKIERICKDRVAEGNSSQSDDKGNALQSSNHNEQSSNNTEQSNSHAGDASGRSIVIQQPVPQGDVAILAIGDESGTVILPQTCTQTKAPQKSLQVELLLNEDIEYITWLIIREFRYEVISTYYVDPISAKSSKNSKAKLSRGRLRNRFKNTWNFLNYAKRVAAGVLRDGEQVDTDQSNCHDPDGQESKILLQCGDHNNDPEETKKLWALALKIRISEILALQKRTVQLVLTHWPTLTLNEYQDLVSSN
ncbi:hypothetical protein QAD02_013865 [Eretmocerus hayati]|uniref:Uncharacterized protein n=1 Tax=Eretmocerus hayati TaxID=131215 RepID=A0ACC2P4P6_9HYME|nr:hypothetical protein QAD02_013865 [Eretmocerus hayati]